MFQGSIRKLRATLPGLVLLITFPAISQCLPHQWTTQDSVLFKNSTVKHQGYPISVYSSAARSSDIANVIYLHGFGDTAQNHRWMFNRLYEARTRVISFDYPEHGKSDGVSINNWTLRHLAQIIPTLFSKNSGLNINPNLPTILVGWSTGGTLALRISQSWRNWVFEGEFKNKLAGVVALAPGVPVRSLTSRLDIRNEVLTQCPDGLMPPKPASPLFGLGKFVASLISTSKEVEKSPMPSDVPSLIMIAKESDEFVLSERAVTWSFSKNRSNRTLRAIQCEQGFHGLEFEPGALGEEIRVNVEKFVIAAALGKTYDPITENCKLIK